MRTFFLQCWAELKDYLVFLIFPSPVRSRAGALHAGELHVSYGFATLPKGEDKVGGGIIKLQDLSRYFPNCDSDIDILYLVSSALPLDATVMVRQARKAGVKVVLNQNGVAYPAWHGAGWEHTNRPLRKVLEYADHVFYQSDFCKKSADRFLCVAPRGQEILHNAVDTTVFVPRRTERAVGTLTLLVAGSHCQYYRLESTLHTLALLRRNGVNSRLLIAGRLAWCPDPDVARKQVESVAQSLKIDSAIEIIGPYSQTEAVSVFQRADILLHTQYNDSCPRLVLEAMACGVPVVYSSSGGTSELVGDEGGRGITAPLDWETVHCPAPEELAMAVQTVVENYNAYASGARARAVGRFDVQPWLRRHREVFTQLVKCPS